MAILPAMCQYNGAFVRSKMLLYASCCLCPAHLADDPQAFNCAYMGHAEWTEASSNRFQQQQSRSQEHHSSQLEDQILQVDQQVWGV